MVNTERRLYLTNRVRKPYARRSSREHMRQGLLFTLLSDLPTVWGALLRAKVYRQVLGSVGSSCFIEKNVHFHVPRKIFFGDRVFVGENVCFDANNIESEIRLEQDVHIAQNSIIRICRVDDGPTSDRVHISPNVLLNAYNYLCSCGGIEIGKYSVLGFDVSLIGIHKTLRGSHSSPMETGKIKIGEDVWLGAHVSILPGVTIGKGSVVGAGAVVMKDIPRYSIAVGFPAKVIGKRK